MKEPSMRHRLSWLATALLLCAGAASAQVADVRSDYGVTLAMSGEEARAESLFITMLSHTRGDARALNNLGNIRLLRDETSVALAFYDRALRGDSLDAGIHLNRATALLVMGDSDRAAIAYARGVQLAGGVEQAQALLGILPEKQPDERASKKTVIDPEQVRAMLKQAAAAVPTAAVQPAASGGRKGGKTASAWRSAGPRASDGSETPGLLYWKR
jgi:tetratricopeptide (TPR) repeat protein